MQDSITKIVFFNVIVMMAFPYNTFAIDNIPSPNVKKGKLAIQYRAGYDFDDLDSKDDRQPSSLVTNYGITDKLRPEVKVILSNNPSESVKVTGFETSLRWQFLKPEDAWLAAALDVNYKASIQSGRSDRLDIKVILGKEIGQLSNITTFSLEEEIGENSRNGPSFKASWKARYKINPYISPGFEFYANTGKLRDNLDFNDQSYRIGPIIYGNITEDIKYNLGYIFGISDAATDGRVKTIISYVKKF